MPLAFEYGFRSFFARLTRASMTAGVVAAVVLSTALLLGLIHSLQQNLASTGHPLNLIVMRKGSDSEASSSLPLEAYQTLRYLEGVARDGQGNPLASPELVVQPVLETHGGVRENLIVRGIEDSAFGVHEGIRVIAGRTLHGAGEALVGRAVTERYVGASIGSKLAFGRSEWIVVGVFENGGSSFESEIWVDAGALASDALRSIPFSAIRLRATSASDVEALARRIADDSRWALTAKSEVEYYEGQASSAGMLYLVVFGVALLAGTGACFGISNTLYASVEARRKEIGTLRALGFARRTIVTAFLVESVLTALVGALVGGTLALLSGWLVNLIMGGIAFPSSTFIVRVVALSIGVADVAIAILLALTISLVGGLAPALRAARLRPVEALRKAA